MSRSHITFATLIFSLVVAFSFYSSLAYRYRPAVDEVCSIVLENYYDLNALQNFKDACVREKHDFPKFLNAAGTAKRINDLLSYISTSHLSVYDPSETDQIWLHESLDNGIRARNIGGFIIVSEILPGSPASKFDLKPGDIISSIDGHITNEASDIRGRSGVFVVLRHDFAREIKITAVKFEEDDSLKIEVLRKDFAVLKVKSFLSGFFISETLDPVLIESKKYPNLIVDLRGNMGGSFPAMMRLLSALTCEPKLVGSLLVSTNHEVPELDLEDKLEVASQLAQIKSAQKINLQIHRPKICLKSHLWVLVDRQTASVSEIFADYLKLSGRAEILGQLTAGQVVMAQWFSIDSLGTLANGSTYSLSVPIADYQNHKLIRLEDIGVPPNSFLNYELAESLQGHDSWVDQILKMRHKQARTK